MTVAVGTRRSCCHQHGLESLAINPLVVIIALGLVLFSSPLTAQPGTQKTHVKEGRRAAVVHQPPGDAPHWGPTLAPVTIEFFADLSDHRRTVRVLALLHQLVDRHPRRLRVIFRLVKGRRTGSDEFVESGLEAFAQGRFFPYLEEYYRATGSTPRREWLPEIAERAGLDRARFSLALKKQLHAAQVIRNYWRKERYGIRRTPGLLINGVALAAPRDLAAYEAAYDAAFQQSQLALGNGVRLKDLYRHFLTERIETALVPRVGVGPIDGGKVSPELAFQRYGFPLHGPIDYLSPHLDGSESAPVAVVVYCGPATRNCYQMLRELNSLRAAYADRIRVVYKPINLHYQDDEADTASLLLVSAECAAEQSLFWPFMSRLARRTSLPTNVFGFIESVATRVGADVARLRRCIAEAGESTEALDAVAREVRQLGVLHTPSVVVGGRLYVGSLSFSQLSVLVELELAPGLLQTWLNRIEGTTNQIE